MGENKALTLIQERRQRNVARMLDLKRQVGRAFVDESWGIMRDAAIELVMWERYADLLDMIERDLRAEVTG